MFKGPMHLNYDVFVTARNSSCGKVMFSDACVCHSVHGVGYFWCLVPGPMSFLGVGYLWSHVPSGGGRRVSRDIGHFGGGSVSRRG